MKEPTCPQCATEYVIRVRRLGIEEHLLSLGHIYPFRCQLCGFRFRFLQRGVKYQRVEEDRRIYDRITTDFSVAFTGDNIEGRGSVGDVSMSGCTIQTESHLSTGKLVRLSLHISDDLPPVLIDTVVRNARLNRVGVEFLKFQKDDRRRLEQFIRNLLPEAANSAGDALASDTAGYTSRQRSATILLPQHSHS